MRKLEVYYLANKSENLYFTILGDCSQSAKEEEEFDTEIVQEGYIQIERLKMVFELEQDYCPDYYILSGGVANTLANKSEAKAMYDYLELKKKILGYDDMHMYDIYVDIIDEKPKEIKFEEGKKIIFEALKPLGKTYLDDLKKAFDERWIDIYPNRGKHSGADSWGSYGTYPYLLLNYNNTIDSVSTLIHELGHSMHSYYSDKNQSYVNHQYPIFLAEIASTTNEILLNDYLYKNATDKNEKILYLTELLEKIRTTIYRQTMFAEFEYIAHDAAEKGMPLTKNWLNEQYLNLNKKYYGKDIISDDEIAYEWARIPHFYSSFYVYKYATGLSCAIKIATDIINEKENALDNYLEFLSSGGSDYPLNILEKTGIDMTKPDTINDALKIFKEKVEELKKLTN